MKESSSIVDDAVFNGMEENEEKRRGKSEKLEEIKCKNAKDD